MPWALLIAAAGLLVVGIGIGWPWGVVAVAGCLVLPVVIVEIMHRAMPPHIGRPLERQSLRARVITITPEQVVTRRQAIPSTVERSTEDRGRE